MTDNEIIEAAEYCTNGRCLGCVREHNIFRYASDCRYDLMKSLLLIANRQKAEIERLKSDNDILSKDLHNLCKELDAEKLRNF